MGETQFIYNKKAQYWFAQLGGWGIYYLLVYLSNDELQKDPDSLYFLIGRLVVSVLLTHGLRYVILKFNWFKNKPPVVFTYVVIATLFCSFLDWLVLYVYDMIIPPPDDQQNGDDQIILYIIVKGIFYFMWCAIYFAYHYINKSRLEEIKNIQLEASKTETELKNLKSQLNPHFMFNSMNSIRALVDENPERAKFAITQLSSILRNTLLMGKSKEVSLADELSVVKDYLSLEAIRYEERLKVHYDIDKSILAYAIPPMMIQNLAENAIKHGIGKLPKGGALELMARSGEDGKIMIRVQNSGRLEMKDGGIGLRNIQQRLELLYGEGGSFKIYQNKDKVVSEIIYPKVEKNESNHNR